MERVFHFEGKAGVLYGGIHREYLWIEPFHFGNPIARDEGKD